MGRKKGPDEIFCRSCGEPIKKRAEICPNCGVANEHPEAGTMTRQSQQSAGIQSEQQVRSQSAPATVEHDPSAYTTTVSEQWYYGVAASIVIWIVGFAMPEGSAVAGAFFLIGWVLMPVSIYYDREWVRATTEWDPGLNPWVILAAIPLVNLVGGSIYLFKRYNTQKVASARNKRHRSDQAGDDPLENLRARYSRGELSDEEFERKVEQIVGTEDRETAQVHMNDRNRSQE